MPTTTYQIRGGASVAATQVIEAGDGQTLVWNQSQTVTIFIGDVNTIQLTDTSGIVAIGPNGAVTFDGNTDKFVITGSTSPVPVATILGGADVSGNVNAFVTGTVNVTSISGTVSVTGSSVTVSGEVSTAENITYVGTTPVIAAGTTSAVYDFPMPTYGEGYLLEVIPQHPGSDIFACDVLIQHVDANGVTIAFETVTVSNFQNLGNDASVIRGRMLGTQINVQVVTAASSWLNGVTGGSGITADSVAVHVFALPTYVTGTGKRVPVIQASDGLLLANSDTVTLSASAGTATFVGVLPDYTGPVVLSVQTELGGGTTFSGRINCYTVSNGTATLAVIETPPCTIITPQSMLTSLPSTFNIALMVQRNTSGTPSAGMSVLIYSADQ
jgi:hypothetical protein